ncbi:probable inactive receptor kinase At5g67200 [Macadamia integrifolia]|uniref:probable inactive receptor kinase At5g67200 n=1 Tax=Macadamia integrifolia TaxID=60698 RepID=UPI001C4EAD12|nr:probable inactive receptor kinase At5g67200 [Macadamia integrifolia]
MMTSSSVSFSSVIFLPLLSILVAVTAGVSIPISMKSELPSDAQALLAFKSKADLEEKLPFLLRKRVGHCQWPGVKCAQGRVVRLVLVGYGIAGSFAPNTLSRLDQLRVLSLQNNSLSGPIPDLSNLTNIRTLFLDHNSFSGSFPPSILSLHRLRTLDLSFNNLTGAIPPDLTSLDRLYYLRLDNNRFYGSVPPLNQSSLQIFNVSSNNLTGGIPVTVTLSRFHNSFSANPGLCGEIVHQECRPHLPFFGPSALGPPPTAVGQNEQVQGLVLPPPSRGEHKRTTVVVGFSIAILVLVGSLICFVAAVRKRSKQRVSTPTIASDAAATADAAAVMRVEEENELEAKVNKMREMQVGKSGCLVFCAGEPHSYTLEQLMRASAEMLGRGTIGTTYKAMLDNQLIVSVKRLDSAKTAITSLETFEQHMESVGGLRHPNLVPLRAYFQAKEERLLIHDYQPNGSLFSLIHGSRSTRAKPLHWTSCLKIAEDVAQGLAYIHQASRLVHGNLKSSNVLLGPDFEACLTDYCLAVLGDDDVDSTGYRAPETRKSTRGATPKSDVYAFGVLLLELLTGKPPSQHPSLMPTELQIWVASTRDEDGEEENRLAMLTELAATCILTSPEQRPTMWQVLKMIQEIKETVMVEDNNELQLGFS